MKKPVSLLLAVALFGGALVAQAPSAPQKETPAPADYSYSLNEAKDLRIALLEFQVANASLNSAIRDWNEACESLRVAKGWPKGTTCNIANGQISPPPPEPAKPADPTPPSASKK